jgi:glycosyltransferase involved in cell wall biosynthesis
MGAVSFSLDSQLVDALQSALKLEVLVETGTFKGDTVAAMAGSFDRIISIELSQDLWAEAAKRFADQPHVQILQGDSAEQLRTLSPELQSKNALYWLDAHWCVADNTAGELSQCPLLQELQAINRLNDGSVVLIDDARLFLAPPPAPHEITQWPAFNEIIKTLQGLSANHELMIVNDVIVVFPPAAREAVQGYAQLEGVDWLVAANTLRQNQSLVDQIKGKEEFILKQNEMVVNLAKQTADILQQHQGLVDQIKGKEEFILKQNEMVVNLTHQIAEKESVIQEQNRVIQGYRAYFKSLFFLRPLQKMINRLKLFTNRVMRRLAEILRPRLGHLSQYTPRPLTTLKAPAKNTATADLPKISIVTPSFNQGGFIERTLLSVIDQQYPALEYFVQDGNSKDKTVEVLQEYQEKLSGWASEKDSGQSQAINRGFAKTSGEIMAWLNSDDLLLPGSLQTVGDYFNRHPDVDVVYGNRLMIDGDDQEIGRWIMPGHDGNVLSWVDYVPQETLFWRRRLWDKVGGHIDESFCFAMDWDLLVRFRDAGAKFAHIPQFLGAFRVHSEQKTSAAINTVGFQEMDRIRERLLGRIPSHPEIRRAVLPFLLKHIWVDILYRIKIRVFRSA